MTMSSAIVHPPPPISPHIYFAVPPHIVDIDAEDVGHPEFVAEYAKEIYSYLSELEVYTFITFIIYTIYMYL